MKCIQLLPVFFILLFMIAPATASTKKITQGATVFIGESDIDISSALNGCKDIGVWNNGADVNTDKPLKNISIMSVTAASSIIYHYNFSPSVFTGYNGTWYCDDKKPYYKSFQLEQPQITIKFWNLDNSSDVSGTSIPFSTNITYQILTNMVPALSYTSRPNLNPSDTFYTISMTDPLNRPVNLLYTGSAGNSRTVILPFDTNPMVTASPYFGKNMNFWDHSARNVRGEPLYPPGTYQVTASVNLNGMAAAYQAAGMDSSLLSSSAQVTLQQNPSPVITVTSSEELPNVTMVSEQTTIPTLPVSGVTTSVPVAKKTTYSPLPVWVSFIGLALGAIAVLASRR